MENEKENYSTLKNLVIDLGGSLFGVADIRDLKNSFVDLPPSRRASREIVRKNKK
ncbi:MAG: hypothetical protein AB1401_03245 [Thermodesulfobacteriota bacterium]